jgi:hypothetical protein
VKTLPGVREAIEQKDWAMVDRQVALLSAAIERAAGHISSVATLLESGK